MSRDYRDESTMQIPAAGCRRSVRYGYYEYIVLKHFEQPVNLWISKLCIIDIWIISPHHWWTELYHHGLGMAKTDKCHVHGSSKNHGLSFNWLLTMVAFTKHRYTFISVSTFFSVKWRGLAITAVLSTNISGNSFFPFKLPCIFQSNRI